jgi:hypothetical protein
VIGLAPGNRPAAADLFHANQPSFTRRGRQLGSYLGVNIAGAFCNSIPPQTIAGGQPLGVVEHLAHIWRR